MLGQERGREQWKMAEQGPDLRSKAKAPGWWREDVAGGRGADDRERLRVELLDRLGNF